MRIEREREREEPNEKERRAPCDFNLSRREDTKAVTEDLSMFHSVDSFLSYDWAED